MKKWLFLLFLLPYSLFSQSDEINISASFAQSIELKIISTPNVTFNFATIEQYQKGYHSGVAPGSVIEFQIASSTNFQVDVNHTTFTSGSGDELNHEYFFYRIRNKNGDTRGTRFNFGTEDFSDPTPNPTLSGSFHLDGTTKTIILPGPNGNAGSFEDNHYHIQIGVGVAHHNGLRGLPSLLDANITPGTYTATLTLTAVPVIL